MLNNTALLIVTIGLFGVFIYSTRAYERAKWASRTHQYTNVISTWSGIGFSILIIVSLINIIPDPDQWTSPSVWFGVIAAIYVIRELVADLL